MFIPFYKYIYMYVYTHTHLHLCTHICLTFTWKDNDDKVYSHNDINNKNSNDSQFISKFNYPIHLCALMYNNECNSCRFCYFQMPLFSSFRALFISRDGSLGCSFKLAANKTCLNPTANILQ